MPDGPASTTRRLSCMASSYWATSVGRVEAAPGPEPLVEGRRRVDGGGRVGAGGASLAAAVAPSAAGVGQAVAGAGGRPRCGAGRAGRPVAASGGRPGPAAAAGASGRGAPGTRPRWSASITSRAARSRCTWGSASASGARASRTSTRRPFEAGGVERAQRHRAPGARPAAVDGRPRHDALGQQDGGVAVAVEDPAPPGPGQRQHPPQADHLVAALGRGPQHGDVARLGRASRR